MLIFNKRHCRYDKKLYLRSILKMKVMEKKHNITDERQNTVSEAAVASETLTTLKEQAIESIMHIKKESALQSVLDFLKKKEEEEAAFERDWERAISLEEFHERCISRLKEMYGKT